MRIEEIRLHRIQMPLKSPFANRLTVVSDRELIIVEAFDSEGRTGLGECVAFSEPWYTEETVDTCWHVMERFLIPLALGQPLEHPREVSRRFAPIRRNHMAKAAIEGAVWDLYCRRRGLSLAEALGGTRRRIEAGVAVGAQLTMDRMLGAIEERVSEGYRRIKVKIKPGADLRVLERIRGAFPDLPLMADANSAYTLADLPKLKQLDDLNLLMIEQPLAADDIVDHAKVQAAIQTPVCLDESICSVDDARRAIELGSCRVINVKIGRVGGLWEAKRIHDLCRERGIDLWCGGMLEAGVSRAHNIALASLPHFNLPGDISASSRYWERDVTVPEVTVDRGMISVPREPGIGVELDRHRLDEVTVASRRYP
ncbi:o-succinylbenzoate synthase [Paludifilum halophilum]|uniref:o-succinylbenzoate synthase n=1 Tax=Paludifilum halophilum TaxID=1642702 RepID=A0A235B490_9BACL|nr:o-succinylbenzoate synthase [Paludifilum halophilum]OYD07093.1 o-succinylbenzoate synthase [Paludifilum halophilum]